MLKLIAKAVRPQVFFELLRCLRRVAPTEVPLETFASNGVRHAVNVWPLFFGADNRAFAVELNLKRESIQPMQKARLQLGVLESE